MDKVDALARFQRLFTGNYAPWDRLFVRGEGCRLFDRDGRAYLDFCSGIAVNNLGHCHPEVVRAIREQAGRLMHISNLYLHDVELELAERLIRLTHPGRLFLCQSGAEANEAAIKLARKHARAVRKENRWKVVAARGSFHGRTMGALAATGQEKYWAGFEPLVPGFVHVPYNDLDAVAEAIDGETCAVMMEPIQGEGGVMVPDEGWLAQLARLCSSKGVLLILDEVQTGFGRTGSLFACQGEGVVPDILTMAKSFGGGLPLGGMLAKPEVAAAFVPGTHASTFGGNPVSCAAALAVLRVMEAGDLPGRAREMGNILMKGLAELRQAQPELTVAVRGRGLLVGLEVAGGAREIQGRCQQEGLLLSVVQEKVLRFTPPLIVGPEEIKEALGTLARVMSSARRQGGC